MNKPPMKTMLFGHPVVAWPMMLAGVTGLFASLYGGGGLFPALVCGGIAVAAFRANEQVSAYKQWRTAWDAMGDGPVQQSLTLGRVVGGLCAALATFVLLTMPHEAVHQFHRAIRWAVADPVTLAVLAGFVVLAALVKLIRHWRAVRRRVRPSPTVAVIVRPVLPVPSLDTAYRALPDYCRALMVARS